MSSTAQTCLMVLAITIAYIWSSLPAAQYFSLQLVAGIVIAYIFIKKASNAKLWHIAPSALSIEMALVSLGILVLIAATGNLQSVFFPMTYVHLYFLVMALSPLPAILSTLSITLFHYALTPTPSQLDLVGLLTLPILLPIFLTTKKQYDQQQKTVASLEEIAKNSTQEEQHAIDFITHYLQPKLETLWQMAQHPQENRENIETQIKLIHEKSQSLVQEIRQDQQHLL